MSSEKDGQRSEGSEGQSPSSKPFVVRVLSVLKRHLHRYKSANQKPRTEHQINERMMARWTRRLGIFTVILAVIAGITAWILKETDDTLRAGQRAFIGTTTNLIPFRDPASGKIVSWRVNVFLENNGNSSALDVRWTAGWEHEPPQNPNLHDISDFTPRDGGGGMVAPKGKMLIFDDSNFPRARIIRIMKSPGFFVQGTVRYKDIFKASRITRFCIVLYNGPWHGDDTSDEGLERMIDRVDFTAVLCRRNNCADETCEKQK